MSHCQHLVLLVFRLLLLLGGGCEARRLTVRGMRSAGDELEPSLEAAEDTNLATSIHYAAEQSEHNPLQCWLCGSLVLTH